MIVVLERFLSSTPDGLEYVARVTKLTLESKMAQENSPILTETSILQVMPILYCDRGKQTVENFQHHCIRSILVSYFFLIWIGKLASMTL